MSCQYGTHDFNIHTKYESAYNNEISIYINEVCDLGVSIENINTPDHNCVTITCSSFDEKIATITNDGIVTGVATGSCVVRISAKSSSGIEKTQDVKIWVKKTSTADKSTNAVKVEDIFGINDEGEIEDIDLSKTQGLRVVIEPTIFAETAVNTGNAASSSNNNFNLQQYITKNNKVTDISNSTMFGGKPYPSWQHNPLSFVLPGYQNARIIFKSILDKNTMYTWGFLVSPSGLNVQYGVDVQTQKTMTGWVISKAGPAIGTLNLSGYFMDSLYCIERIRFLEAYKLYGLEGQNEYFEYVNNYTQRIIVEGVQYYGIINSISVAKSSNLPFLYQYTITFTFYKDEIVYRSEDGLSMSNEDIRRQTGIFSKRDQISISDRTDLDNNSQVLLTKVANSYDTSTKQFDQNAYNDLKNSITTMLKYYAGDDDISETDIETIMTALKDYITQNGNKGNWGKWLVTKLRIDGDNFLTMRGMQLSDSAKEVLYRTVGAYNELYK